MPISMSIDTYTHVYMYVCVYIYMYACVSLCRNCIQDREGPVSSSAGRF